MIGITGAYPRTDLNLALLGHDPRKRGLIGPLLFPHVPTATQAGTYAKIDGGYIAQKAPTALIKRATRAGYHRVEVKATTGTFACVEYGLEAKIGDDERRKYKNQFNLDKLKAMKIRAMIEADQEADVASCAFNETDFPLSGSTGLSVSVPWATSATATPLANFDAAANAIFDKCGAPRSSLTIAMDEAVAQNLRKTTEFFERMKKAIVPAGGDIEAEEIKFFFGCGEVLIARSAWNTANLGITPVYSRIWDDNYAFVCVTPPRGNIESADDVQACGFTFAWEEDGGLMVTEQYREDATRSDVIRHRQNRDIVLTDTTPGFLLGNLD